MEKINYIIIILIILCVGAIIWSISYNDSLTTKKNIIQKNQACQNGCNHYSSAMIHHDQFLKPDIHWVILEECLDTCIMFNDYTK